MVFDCHSYSNTFGAELTSPAAHAAKFFFTATNKRDRPTPKSSFRKTKLGFLTSKRDQALCDCRFRVKSEDEFDDCKQWVQATYAEGSGLGPQSSTSVETDSKRFFETPSNQ